jgi:8-oxo-dGTP diphosphatase
MESEEMIPEWFPVSGIPYDEMWQDGPHWLPRVLAGDRLCARFVFAADNETVDIVEIERW